MIRSEREYEEARRRIAEDRKMVEQQRSVLVGMGLPAEDVELAMSPLLAFQEQLVADLGWYERARRRELGTLHRLTDLGRWLIALRIANGLTQRQLAGRLGVTEAQVSRDEHNEYHGIGVDRAQRILDALAETITITIGPAGGRAPAAERDLAGVGKLA